MLFYNGCCLAMIEVVTLIDALVVTDLKYLSFVMSHFVFTGFLAFQVLNGLNTNILCPVDDDSSKTYDDLNDK